MEKHKTIPEDQKKYKCEVEGCDKRCANPAALKNHVRFKHPVEFIKLYPEGGGDSTFRGEGSGKGKGEEGGSEEDKDDGWVPW